MGRHAGGGGVGPVDRAEGVGHIHAVRPGQAGHGLSELRVVFGLALLKAGVLEEHDLAGLQRGGLGACVGAHHVAGEDDLPAQQLAQALGHGLHAQGLQGLLPLLPGEGGGVLALLGLLLGPLLEAGLRLAQVGAGDDRRPLVQQVLNGGQGRADTLIVRDRAGGLVLGDIEVAAQKDLLALDIDVLYGFFVVVHASNSFQTD